jgi:endonuclease YncB( thermonuclease family)
LGRVLTFKRAPKPFSKGRLGFRRLVALAVITVALAFAAVYLLPDKPRFASGVTAATPLFSLCGEGARINCVVDGDTFWFHGVKVRVADIDTPETHPARCAYEADLGKQATDRMLDLLNAGPFELRRYGSRDTDKYGRKLRMVYRDEKSLGTVLVEEGLAREWTGHRKPWCSTADLTY